MAKKSSRTTQSTTTVGLSPEQFLDKTLGHNEAQKLLKSIRAQHNSTLQPRRFTIRLPFGTAAKAARSHKDDVAKLAGQYGWTPPEKQS